MKPLVSIIAPCYNHAKYITGCIESILIQRGCRIELILIDDCSNDDSVKIARDHLSERTLLGSGIEKVHIIENEQNIGAHATINKGLSLAQGSYIGIINTDDLYHPSRLEILVDLIDGTSSDLVFSGISCINSDTDDVNSADSYFENSLCSLDSGEFSIEFLSRNPAITTGNLLFRRTLLSAGLRFRPLKYCHDWDFLLSAFLLGKVSWTKEPLYKYRIHENNSFKSLSHVADIETLSVLSNFSYNLYRLNQFEKLFHSYYEWKLVSSSIENLRRCNIVNSKAFCPPYDLVSLNNV